MNDRSADHSQWAGCPPGELGRMLDRVRLKERRRVLKQLGGMAAGLIVLGAGGYLVGSRLAGPGEYHFGGIVCSEVMPLMEDFHAERLDAELAERVRIHLRECPDCGPAYRRMFPEADEIARSHRRARKLA